LKGKIALYLSNPLLKKLAHELDALKQRVKRLSTELDHLITKSKFINVAPFEIESVKEDLLEKTA